MGKIYRFIFIDPAFECGNSIQLRPTEVGGLSVVLVSHYEAMNSTGPAQLNSCVSVISGLPAGETVRFTRIKFYNARGALKVNEQEIGRSLLLDVTDSQSVRFQYTASSTPAGPPRVRFIYRIEGI